MTLGDETAMQRIHGAVDIGFVAHRVPTGIKRGKRRFKNNIWRTTHPLKFVASRLRRPFNPTRFVRGVRPCSKGVQHE